MDIDGTTEGDFIEDTSGDDLIDADAGDDDIFVTNGHDKVDGGPGEDVLFIDWGAETVGITNAAAVAGYTFRLVGGAGRSVDARGVEYLSIIGGSGNDNFTGAGGDDNLYDADPLSASTSGNDTLGGGGGDDTIEVSDGQDVVDGGDGRDRLTIDYGDLTIAIASAAAAPGFDARYVSGGNWVDLVRIEDLSIRGSRAGDTINGMGGDDTLSDGRFFTFDNDILNGAGGDDLIYLVSGNDAGDGGDGDDIGWLNWYEATAPIVMGVAPAGYDIRFESGANRSANFTNIESFIINGGSGSDVIVGRGGNDTFFDHDSAIDSDSFEGGGGDDSQFTRRGLDRGDGGEGIDTGHLQWSDATSAIVMGIAAAGYDIRFVGGDDRRVDWKSFEKFRVETGSGNDDIVLRDGDDFIFDSGGNDRFDSGGGNDVIKAGAGNDEALGGGGNDDIAGQDGDDTLRGGDGNDILSGDAGTDLLFGDAGDDAGRLSDDSDSFTGGAGTDTAIVAGQFASFTVRISADTEVLLLASGTDTRFGAGTSSYDYNIIVPNAAAGPGSILTVQATGLVVGEDLIFNGSAQQNGAFRIFAGRGVDQLTGGAQNDGFFFDADANGSLTGADRINGGGGTDTIALRGDYTGAKAVTFAEDSMSGIEVITFLTGLAKPFGGPIVPAGFDYAVTMANGNVASGGRMDIIGGTLGADESVAFDGRAETDGSYRIFLGAGADTAFGSQGADLVYGAGGADQLDGSGGADTYVYRLVSESTAAATDNVTLGDGDKIDLATIDADSLAAGDQAFAFIGSQAFGNVAGQLRAVQSGNVWVVEGDVDGNGIADLVINVTSVDAIVAGDFIL